MMAASSHRCALMSRQTERAILRNGGVCKFQKITALPTLSGARVVSSQYLAFQSFHQRFIHFTGGSERLRETSNRSGLTFKRTVHV